MLINKKMGENDEKDWILPNSKNIIGKPPKKPVTKLAIKIANKIVMAFFLECLKNHITTIFKFYLFFKNSCLILYCCNTLQDSIIKVNNIEKN